MTVLTIPLQRLDDLFAPPLNDPYQPGFHTQSGMERLAQLISQQQIREPLKVIFVLPASGTHPEKTVADVQAAVRRYAEVIESQAQIDGLSRRRSTVQSIGMGILILAGSLTLGATLTTTELLSPNLRNLLANTVSILGTVALWSPVDALLFGLRPLRKTERTMQTIRAATIELQYREPDQ